MQVRVWKPVDYEDDAIASVIGQPPLTRPSLEDSPGPFITVDGRIHGLTSNFLRHYCAARPDLATATRIASDLAGWVGFLVNQRNLAPYEDSRDPVLVATEDDFAAYYRLRQYGTEEAVLTSDGWRHSSSSIKRFYEYLQRNYQHIPPFQIVTFSHPGGWSGTTIASYAPRRRSTGSAGTPLTPEFAHLLLMGALRVDLKGHQKAYLGADRDYALISLGLASGLRRNNLANTTVYELPRPCSLPFTTMRVADHITKGDAGGDTMVFSHHLAAVWNYVDGARAELVRRTAYRPPSPLEIIEANSVTVRYRDPGSSERVMSQRWTQCDETFRRRLVEADASSPIVFLNEHTGAPLAYSSLQHTVADASSFVRAHLNADFPDGVRLHDLRHTYAVHLTVAIYRNVIANSLPESRREDWQVDHVAAAVELVKFSLGHASESSTRLYILAAHRFLHIPVEQFLGEF